MGGRAMTTKIISSPALYYTSGDVLLDRPTEVVKLETIRSPLVTTSSLLASPLRARYYDDAYYTTSSVLASPLRRARAYYDDDVYTTSSVLASPLRRARVYYDDDVYTTSSVLASPLRRVVY